MTASEVRRRTEAVLDELERLAHHWDVAASAATDRHDAGAAEALRSLASAVRRAALVIQNELDLSLLTYRR